jgi:hypothetical protein
MDSKNLNTSGSKLNTANIRVGSDKKIKTQDVTVNTNNAKPFKNLNKVRHIGMISGAGIKMIAKNTYNKYEAAASSDDSPSDITNADRELRKKATTTKNAAKTATSIIEDKTAKTIDKIHYKHSKEKDIKKAQKSILKEQSKIKPTNGKLSKLRGNGNKIRKKAGSKIRKNAKQAPKVLKSTKNTIKKSVRNTAKTIKATLKLTMMAIKAVVNIVFAPVAIFITIGVVLIVCFCSMLFGHVVSSIITLGGGAIISQEQQEDQMLSPDMVFSNYQYELTMDLLDAEFPGGLRLNEDDVAAVLSNLQAESGISPASPQVDDYGKVINVGGSPEEYIINVNNGTYSKEQFASDGVGFGLASWTYPDLKRELYEYAKQYADNTGQPFKIDDYTMQKDFLILKMGTMIVHDGKTMVQILKSTPSNQKAYQFCRYFENPAKENYAAHIENYTTLRTYVTSIKNGTGGQAAFVVLNGNYFYQIGSGPCNACSCANLWMRYFCFRGAKKWQSFGINSKTDDNIPIYEKIVSNSNSKSGTKATWGQGNITKTYSGWSPGCTLQMTYGGVTGKYVTFSVSDKNFGNTLRATLAAHPEGVLLYRKYGTGKYHAILITRYDNKRKTFCFVDPAGGAGSGVEKYMDTDKPYGYTTQQIESGNGIVHYGYIEPVSPSKK